MIYIQIKFQNAATCASTSEVQEVINFLMGIILKFCRKDLSWYGHHTEFKTNNEVIKTLLGTYGTLAPLLCVA
jgi:hypothetical protein